MSSHATRLNLRALTVVATVATITIVRFSLWFDSFAKVCEDKPEFDPKQIQQTKAINEKEAKTTHSLQTTHNEVAPPAAASRL
jgi:hypothetical protein